MDHDLDRLTNFTDEEITRLSAPMKVGLLATVNPHGEPHLTMISTLMAGSPDLVVWGQFTEGLSKEHVRQNPRTGFLIMTLDRCVWRGQADYIEARRSGPEYEQYNNIPMFRYNAYFGIHTVHYMKLRSHTGGQPLPMSRIVPAALQTLAARTLTGKHFEALPVMNTWTRSFLNKLDTLKFLAYVGDDGFPWIVPAIQTQSLDSERVIFATYPYSDELTAIPVGALLAVFGLSLKMEDVLLRGIYLGQTRTVGGKCGIIRLNWAYNSMPPVPGQIYPPVPLRAVREF